MIHPVLDTADVVVIGAGVAGITTAFELRARGYDVIVVEQRFPGYGATGRSSGAVWLQTAATGTDLNLARAGRDLYARYSAEVGDTFDYRQTGGMFYFEREDQGAILEDYISDRRAAGLDIEMLDRRAAHKHSSLLPDTAIGAVFCADDAQIDASRFVRAVSDACIRRGIRSYENTTVLGSLRARNGVEGIRTTRGDIHAPGVVWATGAWAVSLTAEGIDLPISTARQGQLLTQAVSPADSPILRGPRGVAWAPALTRLPAYDRKLFSALGQETSVSYDDTLTQNRENELLIGSSIDAPGALNPHIGMAATQAMLNTAMERYPEQAGLGIVGLWAGVIGWTQDALPLVGRVDGVYVNTGHTRGIATGPISGEVMAACVAGEDHTFAASLSVDRSSL